MPANLSPTQQISQVGMLNPPRKAKRLRELVSREEVTEPTSALAQSARRSMSPLPVSGGPRQRGRKPAGPMSRAAREQLRKTNHSVIEKRRREKINEALAALRELVPNDKPDGEEKEFKLEVLVRTVEYLRMMVTKVRSLEEQTCTRCGGSLAAAEAPSPIVKGKAGPATGKRKRPANEDSVVDDSVSDDEDFSDVYLPPTPAQAPISSGLQSPASPQCFPQLPSISSWMPSSPIESPALAPHILQRPSPPHPYQLPSPPQSAPFAPTNSSISLPRLTLPPGMQPPTSPGVHAHRGTSMSPPFDREVPDLPLERALRASPKHADADGRGSDCPVSPWTRDDQTAASLLLNMSSSRAEEAPRDVRDGTLEAQTPSSVLGMGE